MSSPAFVAVEALRRTGATVATAESLTGGLLCAALVDVPGASDVVRGGVVAYAPDLKSELLGVDPDLVLEHGTIHPDVAEQMAMGAARSLAATWGVATTGAAGPDPSEGRPVGTVHVAVATAGDVRVHGFTFTGDRLSIREQTVAAALSALVARLGEESGPTRG